MHVFVVSGTSGSGTEILGVYKGPEKAVDRALDYTGEDVLEYDEREDMLDDLDDEKYVELEADIGLKEERRIVATVEQFEVW